MEFLRVKEGPHAGEFVRVRPTGPAIIRDAIAPRNPYPTGYGRKIPTAYRVRTIDQRWRRVYVVRFSNVGTAYIIEKGQRVIVEIDT